jgi:hypothetical protein
MSEAPDAPSASIVARPRRYASTVVDVAAQITAAVAPHPPRASRYSPARNSVATSTTYQLLPSVEPMPLRGLFPAALRKHPLESGKGSP